MISFRTVYMFLFIRISTKQQIGKLLIQNYQLIRRVNTEPITFERHIFKVSQCQFKCATFQHLSYLILCLTYKHFRFLPTILFLFLVCQQLLQVILSIYLKHINQQITMQPPKSTVDNTNNWRLWHGFNYFIGGGTFLLGSILLFPIFANYLDTAEVSGWLYTIGSATFLLADITEWLHYVYKDCRFMVFAINFFVSASGSLLYLIGSACFIPEIGQFDWGMSLFIYGSALIMISQTWKLVRSLIQKDKSCSQCYKQDPSGFWVDLYAGLGAFMYFSGTFVFQKTTANPDLTDWAALIYSFGGLFFFSSALYMQKRYFWEKNQLKIYQDTDNSVVSAEI